MSTIQRIALLALVCFAPALNAQPAGADPVQDFELDRYLGQWYEIARLDHFFERGMSHVTANYSMRDDGKVRVVNRGYKTKKSKWDDAEGKARFAGETDVGHLEVSFFWIFYGDYIIFELDPDYQYAWVSSGDTDYLWFLSRTPTISDELKERFLARVDELGFDTSELIFVEQLDPPPQ